MRGRHAGVFLEGGVECGFGIESNIQHDIQDVSVCFCRVGQSLLSFFDPESIYKTCVENLDGNAVPSYLQVVNVIPKSASEKNLDRLLRDEFTQDAENVYAFEDYK